MSEANTTAISVDDARSMEAAYQICPSERKSLHRRITPGTRTEKYPQTQIQAFQKCKAVPLPI
eukprot:6491997-Amphidinium_carterae.1